MIHTQVKSRWWLKSWEFKLLSLCEGVRTEFQTVYHSVCKSSTRWIKTHHIATANITPQRRNNFNCQDFNHHLVLTYIYITRVFLTEIIKIFNNHVLMKTQLTKYLPLYSSNNISLKMVAVAAGTCWWEIVIKIHDTQWSAFCWLFTRTHYGILFSIVFPSMSVSSVSFPQLSPFKPYTQHFSPYSRQKSRPSLSSWFDNPYCMPLYLLRSTNHGTLPCAVFPPFPSFFLPIRPKYFPGYHILEET